MCRKQNQDRCREVVKRSFYLFLFDLPYSASAKSCFCLFKQI